MNSCPSGFNQIEMLLDSDSFIVDRFRNKENRSRLQISSEFIPHDAGQMFQN